MSARSNRTCAALLLSAAAAGWSGAGAFAQAPGKPAAVPLAQRMAACGACHGAAGNSSLANIPSLAGQPKVFVETQLVMIREGLRQVPQMAALLDGVSDADVTAMATHYAAQPVVSAAGERRAAQYERGRELAGKMQCTSCHMPSLQGREQMPRLAGQREDYLAYSMKQFRDNKTTGRDTVMAATLYGVSDADIDSLAHYMAQIK